MAQLALYRDKTVNYFRDSYLELKKVVWPTRKEVIKHTIVVVAMSVIIALFLAALDMIFAVGIEKLLFLKK